MRLAGYAGNVTVTFVCSDADSAVIWCTHPVTVTSEGTDIPVIGSATDAAGNQASVTVMVSIDRTVPAVSIFVPLNASDGPAGMSEVTVKGSVLDASGIASVSCNGIAATVTESLFTCTVGVTAGTNAITVSAYDLAGHLGTRDITFLVGNGPPPTSIEISPSTMTMFAGDSRKVVVKDDRGRTALGGAWSVSDPFVVDVRETDGITTVNAVGPGEATLTVTYRTLVAHATLTVFAAGAEIPSGTTLWSLTDTSGVGEYRHLPRCGGFLFLGRS